MKKNVVVIWDDFYHPMARIEPFIEKVFRRDTWNVTTTKRARDVIETAEKVDLCIFFTNGRPEGETDLTDAEQERFVQKVRAGMSILYYHAGLVLIEETSPFFWELNSGRFVHHPEQCPVKMTPIRNAGHPILEGVSEFAALDEHYFCQVDVSKTDLLMCSTSEHITSVGAWAHQVEKGRIVGITQGHTAEMMGQPAMVRLTQNAAEWCVGLR